MYFMQKYDELNSNFVLGYNIFFVYNIYNINIISGFLLLNKTRICLCLKQINGFQYSFLINNHPFFIIISATVVQIFTIDSKQKLILLSKIHLPTTVTQCCIPQKKIN